MFIEKFAVGKAQKKVEEFSLNGPAFARLDI